MKWKPDGFLLGLLAAIALGGLFPSVGASGGPLYPEVLTKAGVALIFFLHGVALPFESLKAGTLQWRLHLVVQTCTYLLFPLLGMVFLWAAGGWFPAELRLGFFFLCALPSTVSSSVAMTAMAKGNVAAAVFNATLSSLLGVFLTPLWVALILKTQGEALPLGKVVADLILWLILPLAVGQGTRPWLKGWAARHKPLIHWADRGTILLLVFTSFCESTRQGVWSSNSPLVLAGTIAGAAVLLFAALWATQTVCGKLGFTPPDRIAAVFCGSKKTLASGVPMANVIFPGNPALGLILLPLIAYHTLQLIVCGVLASRWARREE